MRLWLQALRSALRAGLDVFRFEVRGGVTVLNGAPRWRIEATFTNPREYRVALERLRPCSHGQSFRAGDTPDQTW